MLFLFHKESILKDLLLGITTVSLAVTEANCGTDVASIECSAVVGFPSISPDDIKNPSITAPIVSEECLIISGEKIWVMNGTRANYFVVAVRTGGQGAHGISLVVVSRDSPGVAVTPMVGLSSSPYSTSFGFSVAGLARVSFTKTPVRRDCILGSLHNGFHPLLRNLNHERWFCAVLSTRFGRSCLAHSFRYARDRFTFGVPLEQHPVIRKILFECVQAIEASSELLESLTFKVLCSGSTSGSGLGVPTNTSHFSRIGGIRSVQKLGFPSIGPVAGPIGSFSTPSERPDVGFHADNPGETGFGPSPLGTNQTLEPSPVTWESISFISMLKVFCARSYASAVTCSQHVFGAAAYSAEGPGAVVQLLAQELFMCSIPTGTDEILSDLAVRLLLKKDNYLLSAVHSKL